MVNVRPLETYRSLYPFSEDELKRVAYYFDFDYEDGRTPSSYAGPLIERVGRWEAEGPVGSLWVVPRPDGSVAILESRRGRREGLVFEGWQAAAYLAFDRARTPASVAEELEVVPEEVAAFAGWCVERGLMVRLGGRYLALAVHRPPRRSVPVAGPADEAMLAGVGRPD
jgi:hypothetical protein